MDEARPHRDSGGSARVGENSSLPLTCARCGDDALSTKPPTVVALCDDCFGYLGQCSRQQVVFTSWIRPPAPADYERILQWCRLHAGPERRLDS